ncbi:MAG: YHS domain-containing protein [Abitibacteriaceae bacterium]|nr:YHS domain-containing protein [Abditibacteriaceae bacterium]MBV9868569.1 YHS domain-containing protein [Abditibacteriaceae bacterium]
MTLVDDGMQAVVIMACEKHAPTLLAKLQECPAGNWFVLPSVASCRIGYWPHVSEAHAGQAIAVFGFVERPELARRLEQLSSVNEDGSLCLDCVAYEWGASPSHIAQSVRDPVCGRPVPCTHALSQCYNGELFFFCGLGCRDAFHKAPEKYVSVGASGRG